MTLFACLNPADVHEGKYLSLDLPFLIEADGAQARVILMKE